MAVTVTSICTMALRKIKVLAAGETIETSDLTDLADELRRMLDTWRLEPLIVVADSIRTFDLDTTKNTYTYYADVAADFNGARPTHIKSATLRDSSGMGYPLAPITSTEWSGSSRRSILAQPTGFYFNAAFPIAEVRLDCMPDPNWPIIELVVQDAFDVSTLEADWADAITLAPGYEDALIYNLACRVHQDYGVALPNSIAGLAAAFKAVIKRANLQVPHLMGDFPTRRKDIRGSYDIIAGPR